MVLSLGGFAYRELLAIFVDIFIVTAGDGVLLGMGRNQHAAK